MKHTLKQLKTQLVDLDNLIRIASTNQDAQIEWLCRPLHKPTDEQRANLLTTHKQLSELRLERWRLARDIAAVPKRSRYFAAE